MRHLSIMQSLSGTVGGFASTNVLAEFYRQFSKESRTGSQCRMKPNLKTVYPTWEYGARRRRLPTPDVTVTIRATISHFRDFELAEADVVSL